MRRQPISPPTEPMQYRAIGLVQGRYVPSEEQFTCGTLVMNDGTVTAVLLGRVMSLVKKHLNLDEEHLWVVYPRTQDKTDELHLQIVGVWEPENLHSSAEFAEESSEDFEDFTEEFSVPLSEELVEEFPKVPPSDLATDLATESVGDLTALLIKESTLEFTDKPVDEPTLDPSVESLPHSVEGLAEKPVTPTENTAQRPEAPTQNPAPKPLAPLKPSLPPPPSDSQQDGESESEEELEEEQIPIEDGYFSVRGEVVFQSYDGESIVVKIKQAPRKADDKPKNFKLKLKGTLTGKAIGQFWDLHVKRQANFLHIETSQFIAALPPKKPRRPMKGRPPTHAGGGRKPAPIRRSDIAAPILASGKPAPPRPVPRPQKPTKPLPPDNSQAKS